MKLKPTQKTSLESYFCLQDSRYNKTSRTYDLEEVVGRVVVEFEVQLLDDDQLHPVDVPHGELTVVVSHHSRENRVHTLKHKAWCVSH